MNVDIHSGWFPIQMTDFLYCWTISPAKGSSLYRSPNTVIHLWVMVPLELKTGSTSTFHPLSPDMSIRLLTRLLDVQRFENVYCVNHQRTIAPYTEAISIVFEKTVHADVSAGERCERDAIINSSALCGFQLVVKVVNTV